MLLAYSITLPQYEDHEKAQKFLFDADERDIYTWFKIDRELRTNKKVLTDLGSGLLITGFAILIYLFAPVLIDFKS